MIASTGSCMASLLMTYSFEMHLSPDLLSVANSLTLKQLRCQLNVPLCDIQCHI